ncbi:tetratricopeptide repeat protein [Actinomadura soli]|uniref:Tetratricopeptide repeat protein n=1 Tax=Actinomadura soli TaxID=2508997 RepID=A0A5C4J130_9ACTN|nr:tetratricopeptide repeat protein [Actinomadura soli]TMQ90212.1 tetratricopeptide repeat protein [Actinomadura soli]
MWFAGAVIAVLVGGRLSLLSGDPQSPPDEEAAGGRTDEAAGGVNIGAGGDFSGANFYLGTSGPPGAGTNDDEHCAPVDPLGRAVLVPPVGRLPEWIRGRDPLLRRLEELIARPDGRVHLLSGLGGTGKSTVALWVAKLAAEQGRTVWWAPAVDASSLTSTLLDLAESLGAAPHQVRGALAGKRDPSDVLWPELEKRPGWVLLIDNADDLAALASGQRTVRDGNGWLRPTRAGLVLVTSRNSDTRRWGPHVENHPVAELPADAGAQVLLDMAPDAGTDNQARVLSARLGGLPLALYHAGSHLASPFARERTFDGYRQALETRFSVLMGQGGADRDIVTSTWELSLNRLAQEGTPQARRLLLVLAQFAEGVPIPLDLLDHDVLGSVCLDQGADGVGPGLAALRSVGLIEIRPADREGDVVTMHPLVRDVSLRSTTPADEPRTLLGTAVDLVGRVADAEWVGEPLDPRAWPDWRLLAPHALHLGLRVFTTADPPTAWVEQLGRVANLGARYLRVRGFYARAEAAYGTILATQRGVLGEAHPQTLETRRRLAGVLHDRGHYEAAEREYRTLFDVGRRALGEDHPEVLASRHGIAHILRHRERLVEAENEYRPVIAARRRILGEEDRRTLTSRQEFATVLRDQGRHEEAEAEYRAVLRTQRQIMSEEDPELLNTQYHLASLLHDSGQFDAAEAEYQSVYRVELRILGADHPNTLETRFQLAHLLRHRGEHQQAENEHRAVLAARRQVLGEDHPDTRARENLDCLAEE